MNTTNSLTKASEWPYYSIIWSGENAMTMNSVLPEDVAAYVLKKTGQISTMKLQKLIYYCQAWSLVWDESPLFEEPIQAWVNGPVVDSLYQKHKGNFLINSEILGYGNESKLNDNQRETIDHVVDFYHPYSAQQLSDLSHKEKPWKDARGNCGPFERCEKEITKESMCEYYTRIAELADGQK